MNLWWKLKDCDVVQYDLQYESAPIEVNRIQCVDSNNASKLFNLIEDYENYILELNEEN